MVRTEEKNYLSGLHPKLPTKCGLKIIKNTEYTWNSIYTSALHCLFFVPPFVYLPLIVGNYFKLSSCTSQEVAAKMLNWLDSRDHRGHLSATLPVVSSQVSLLHQSSRSSNVWASVNTARPCCSTPRNCKQFTMYFVHTVFTVCIVHTVHILVYTLYCSLLTVPPSLHYTVYSAHSRLSRIAIQAAVQQQVGPVSVCHHLSQAHCAQISIVQCA